MTCHDNPVAKEVADMLNNNDISGASKRFWDESYSFAPPEAVQTINRQWAAQAQMEFQDKSNNLALDVKCLAPNHTTIQDPVISNFLEVEFK